MNPKQLLHLIPDAQLGSVTVTNQEFDSLDELGASLRLISGDGWLCTTGRVQRWRGPLPTDEYPLSGELAFSEGLISLHLRFSGGKWRLATIRETISEGGNMVGFVDEFESTVSSDSVPWKLDGKKSRPPNMKYMTWWRPERSLAGEYRPWLSRFAGWEK